MREIKFRAKRKDNGEWVTGYFWRMNDEMNGNKACITVSNVGADNFFNYEVMPETVGVYFGWIDSMGTEIYTDDQLELFWNNGGTTLETISYSQEYGYFMYGNNPVCELAEGNVKSKVVGNIHDQVIPPADSPALNTMNIYDPKEGQEEVKDDQAAINAAEDQANTVEEPDAEEGNTEG